MPHQPLKDHLSLKAAGIRNPIQRPASDEQRRAWQLANRQWWTAVPMRYDWGQAIDHAAGTDGYFAEIDARFFRSVAAFMPWKKIPFEQQIPFEELAKLDVLEVGVGFGTHACLIAPRARSYAGIDLTAPAVEATRRRLDKMQGVSARVVEMDAEEMTFPDASFDFVWSWGVIHHSADPRRLLEQIHRVLRTGGRANVMIYHRSFWKYYVFDGLFKGLTKGGLFRHRSFLAVNQAESDGAIARYYRSSEWTELCSDLFRIDQMQVAGLKTDVIPLPQGAFKQFLLRVIPDAVTRFMTNTLECGFFLMIQMTKK